MDNITNNSSNITNNTNNTTLNESKTTDNTTNNTGEASSKTTKTSKKSSSKSGNDGYHYSAQYGTYIKEWEDSSGSHMVSRDGKYEQHYNEKTGEFREKTPYDGWTSNRM